MAKTTRDIPIPVLLAYLVAWWGFIGLLFVWITSNEPPGAPEVAWKETRSFTNTKLSVNMVKPSVDPDGDIVNYAYVWKRNGEIVPELRGNTVGTEYTRKGDVWEVTITPNDGTRDGFGCVLPWRKCAGESGVVTLTTTIENSPPMARARFFEGEKEVGAYDAGDITVVPTCYDPDFLEEEQAAAAQGASAEASEPADRCTYTFAWWPDGKVVEDGEPAFTTQTVAARDLRKSDVWRVVIKPNDGEIDGTPYQVDLRRAVR